jgi:hypothetical protein
MNTISRLFSVHTAVMSVISFEQLLVAVVAIIAAAVWWIRIGARKEPSLASKPAATATTVSASEPITTPAAPTAAELPPLAQPLGYPLFETPLDAKRMGAKPKDGVAVLGAHGRPLRILCLHGQNSNSDVTLMQLSNLGLSHRLWCDLLEGPWDSDSSPESAMDGVTDAELHSWWPWKKAGDEPNQQHLARCLRYVLHYLDSARIPYDGIFGFSQGAAIATLASMPEVRRKLGLSSSTPPWRFTICAHGMYPGGAWFGHAASESMSGLAAPTLDPSLAPDAHFEGVAPDLLAKVMRVVDVPSLHLMGVADHWRTNAVRLAQMYVTPAIFEHDGRHEIPAKLSRDAPCQQALSLFFERISPLCTI